MTKLIRYIKPNCIPAGSVLTIGNFDGVHLGHQYLIAMAKREALGSAISVMFFEPQPLEYLKPDKAMARLNRWQDKFLALSKLDTDFVIMPKFDRMFATLCADEFIDVLVSVLKIKTLVVGEDFKFGANRQGNVQMLQTAADKGLFKLLIASDFKIGGERVSSTQIRHLLFDGKLNQAAELLGRPYAMTGRVIHGDKLGRTLGFPTANIAVHQQKPPFTGIFTVRMHGIGPTPRPGVAYLGIRPAVGGTKILLEVYLYQFNQTIYDKKVMIEFCKKLRDEAFYPSLDLLKQQIAKDAEDGFNYFKERGELE